MALLINDSAGVPRGGLPTVAMVVPTGTPVLIQVSLDGPEAAAGRRWVLDAAGSPIVIDDADQATPTNTGTATLAFWSQGGFTAAGTHLLVLMDDGGNPRMQAEVRAILNPKANLPPPPPPSPAIRRAKDIVRVGGACALVALMALLLGYGCVLLRDAWCEGSCAATPVPQTPVGAAVEAAKAKEAAKPKASAVPQREPCCENGGKK